jgi:3'-phosphoadenosine 5'-phosphosulfate sulfotransferase (PAPS reductase)/FAD synthetase
VVSWFSCGAASAVATKLAIEQFGAVEIYYTDTGSEHPDNPRFLADCEKWFGQKITTLKSTEYKDAMEVCEKQRFLSSQNGAPCTSAMKKVPANGIWGLGDVEIFGYTAAERHRLVQWIEDNNERRIFCPLIDRGISKDECFEIVLAAGIELPAMYRLGFRNNNCIGCVKARDSLDYWKRVRKYFPAEFERVAKLEKELGHAINRVTRKGEKINVPLYDLPPGDPKGPDPKISCGLFCMSEADEEDPDPMGDLIRETIPNYNPTRYGYSESQRIAAVKADEKPDGQAENVKRTCADS